MPSLAFGPEGRQLLSGDTGGVTRIWNVEGMREVHALPGHDETIYAVAIDPEGRRGYTCSRDGHLRQWDLPSARCTKSIAAGVRVDDLFLDPKGETLFGAGEKGVHCWSAGDLRPLGMLKGSQGSIHSLGPPREVSVSGRGGDRAPLLVGAGTWQAWVWDLERGELLSRLESPGIALCSVALHPSRPLVAAGTQNGSLLLWDRQSGRLLQKLSAAHEGKIWDVDFHPEGHRLASAGVDKIARLWSVFGADVER